MKNILVRMLVVFLFCLSGHARAPNYSDPIDGIFNGVYGDTIYVIVPSQVSKSPVTNQNQSGELSFIFNANTAYTNFSQLSQLNNGDPVRVEYKEDLTGKAKQQMVATAITKLQTAAPTVTVTSPQANTVNYAPPVNPQTVTTTTTTRVNP